MERLLHARLFSSSKKRRAPSRRYSFCNRKFLHSEFSVQNSEFDPHRVPGPCVCEGSPVALAYTGRVILNVVPSFGLDVTVIVPSCSSMIFLVTAKPKPVPRLPLVLWKSSNMCF